MIEFKNARSFFYSPAHSAAWTTCTEYWQKKPAEMLWEKHKEETKSSTWSSIVRRDHKTFSETPVKLQVVVPDTLQNPDKPYLNQQRRNLKNFTMPLPENTVQFSKTTSNKPGEPAKDSPPLKAAEEEGFFSPYIKTLKNLFAPKDTDSEPKAEAEVPKKTSPKESKK